MSATEALFPFRLLERIDLLAHRFGLTRHWPFWRICDQMDLRLGVPDTPENFPRRHGGVRRKDG